MRIAVESFVHRDARYEEIGKSRTEVESFVQQVARYEGIVNHVSGLIHSCIKMHATFEINNALNG